jgi:diguanylate cyclase (GGDEF)-like protein/PAS domain S-box-containing protein
LILESSGEAIIGIDEDGKVACWNAAAERLYGYSASEVLGRPGVLLVAPPRSAELRKLQGRALAGEIISEAETEAIGKDGAGFPVAVTIASVRDARGHLIGTSLVVRDISDRKRLEHELRFFADHDPLTGLFNRRRFMEELSRHTAFIGRYQVIGGALLISDIDSLKYVNDTFGHAAGDELLKAVAVAFRRRLRDTDVVGRMGGDEFAILLPRASLAQAKRVAELLRAAVADIELTIDRRKVPATVSVGIAATRANASPEDVFAAADNAMYSAKRAGRNRAAAAAANGESEPCGIPREPARLLHVIGEDRLEVCGQPIVELTTRAVYGHELFVKIRENDRLLPPHAFIRGDERLGLLDRIDYYMARMALSLLEETRGEDLLVHVNVAGTARAKSEIIALLSRRASAGAVDSSRLTFEVADAAFAADREVTREFAQAVREIGCRVALDHFGGDLGSLIDLIDLPVDFVKLHGRLISGLPDSRPARLVAKAIVDVARGMEMEPIAQRVTSPDAIKLLDEYGVRFGQGPALGEPTTLRAGTGPAH